MLVNTHELSRQGPSYIHIRGVRLKALIVSQDLRGRRSRHRCTKQGVSYSVLSDLRPQSGPIKVLAVLKVVLLISKLFPQILLQLALTHRRALIGFIRSVLLRHLAAGSQCAKVNGLENLLVDRLSLLRVERDSKQHEHVSQALDTNADGTMPHVAGP